MTEIAAFHARVFGRVQGVNYRRFTQRQAIQLGIQGYVRNLSDWSVEVHAEGDKEQLEKLLEILQKGPPAARVESVQTSWMAGTGEYQGFSVTY